MTHLRKMTLDELQRRNYSQRTAECYVRVVEEFARYFDRPPDQLGPEQIRTYQAHLFTDRKLDANTVCQHLSALRFFFIKTLRPDQCIAFALNRLSGQKNPLGDPINMR